MIPRLHSALRLISFVSVICVISGRNSSAAAEPQILPNDHIAIIGNTFADQLRREGYLETLLLQRVVDENGNPAISLRNLGWGGDTLTQRDRPTNFPTEDQTLTEFGADVLLLSFGISESFAGEAGLAEFRADYEALIDHYLGQKYNGVSAPRLILLSPTAYENLGPSTPNVDERNKDLATYTNAIADLAAAKDLGFVDLLTPTMALMKKGAPTPLTVNGVHLNGFGYWFVSPIIAKAIAPAPEAFRLEINAKTKKTIARGIKVAKVDTVSGGLAFAINETNYPAPPPPVPYADAPDRLFVRNLAPATYTLTIDGEEIATAKASEWAKGIPLDNSPTHREVEAYRAQVIDKNEQFTFSWKALNQVHIVGERKTSNSGKELPREVIEFNELAKAKDAELQTLPPNNRTREWRLTATPEK